MPQFEHKFSLIISIHAPRVGSDNYTMMDNLGVAIFQSTLPVWGATGPERHRAGRMLFQSTLPVWGATLMDFYILGSGEFQSTLPVWGATYVKSGVDDIKTISIHAPRVGSDT